MERRPLEGLYRIEGKEGTDGQMEDQWLQSTTQEQ